MNSIWCSRVVDTTHEDSIPKPSVEGYFPPTAEGPALAGCPHMGEFSVVALSAYESKLDCAGKCLLPAVPLGS
jgi:hypothetical protein